MLPANRSAFRGALLTAYIRWELRRHFERILLFGDATASRPEEGSPRIFFSTHQTWWDGFLEIPLQRFHGHRLWLMMEERNLRKFPAFRWVGVFGVDLDSTSGRAAALLYAAKRLREPGRHGLHLYPHGRLVNPGEPWPEFRGGVAELLRLVPGASAVPVAKVLFHARHRNPEAWLELGPPLRGDGASLEHALRETAERLADRVRNLDAQGATVLLPPRRWGTGRT